ncbi:MAG: aminotransferase class V-fold PLP-dependent enzyme [Dehalococcoidia bacterium]
MRLAPHSDFLNLDGLVHLAAGGESPSLRAQLTAVERYIRLKGRSGLGTPDYRAKQDAYDRCKERAAVLFGVTPAEIAFASSVADGASQIALSLPWQSGDNIVLEDVEFLSSLLPWTRLRDRGVEIRVIRHADWSPDEAHFRAAVNERTRLIAVSQVNYLTGIQHNLEALRQIADGGNAMLYADVTHAAGAAPVPARLCDFAVSATYKWLLGCQGVATVVWNRERVPELEPAIVGWRSVTDALGPANDPLTPVWKPTAERLEAGNPPWMAIVYLDVALGYLLDLGLDQVYAHVRDLSARMHEGLRLLGVPLATPSDPRWRAGNNCFWVENPESIAERLAGENILVSGYSGRIRISTHIWNDEADVDRGLAALQPIVTGVAVRAS